MNNNLNANRIELILLFITAFLSAQRYLLPDIYHYACLIPLIAGIYLYKESKILSNTFIFIALFTCVDIGGSSGDVVPFNESSSFIRYLIYLVIITSIALNAKINFKKTYTILLLLFFPLFSTIANIFDSQTFINLSILRSDILVCFLILILFSNENKKVFKLNFHLIYIFFLIFGFFEIINFISFFNYEENYMNFQSTKSLILYPVFYSIVYLKSGFLKIFWIALSLLILIGYVTRMIFISMLLCLFLLLISKIISGKVKFKRALLFIVLFIILISFFLPRIQDLEYIKMISTLSTIIGSDNFFESLQLVDPWRYGELQILFDRDLFSIIFGEGFGAGIYDYNNYLYFANFDQTAYSDKELITGIFYNMHDFWSDFGLRFGLLNISIFLFYLISKIIISQNKNMVFGCTISLVLTLCAFFSVSGIIMNFLILFNANLTESDDT